MRFRRRRVDVITHVTLAQNRLIKFYDEMLRVSVRVIPSELESLSVLPGDQMRVRKCLDSSPFMLRILLYLPFVSALYLAPN